MANFLILLDILNKMSKNIDYKKVEEYVEEKWNKSILESLSKYIEIENQSPDYDELWESNGLIDEAMNHMAKWVKEQEVEGLELEIVKEKSKTPLLFIEVKATLENAPTCLLYGHCDKQVFKI